MKDRLNSPTCSKYLKALADPERLRIVQCLGDGGLPVGEVAARLGVPVANASHHLKQLRIAGLVTGRRKGRFVHYQLTGRIMQRPEGSPLGVLDFGCCRLELGVKLRTAAAAAAESAKGRSAK